MVAQPWRAPTADVRWRATALAVAVICLLLIYRTAFTAAFGGVSLVPWVAALFVLPLLYAFPGAQWWLIRYRWPVLLVQAVLTWVPFALFGGSWPIGVGGLLAGLVLLMVGGVGSWLAAGLLVVADVFVRAAVTGLQPAPGWPGAVWAVVTFVDNAVYLFGMVRLAQIVGEVEQARKQAGALAVARERLQAGRLLQAAIGQRLAGIAARAWAARQALAEDSAEARAQIAAAGAMARETVTRARGVAVGLSSSSELERPAPPLAGVTVGARLAWGVLLVMLAAFTMQGFDNIVVHRDGARLGGLLAAAYLLTVALQLRHSGAARQGRRPRAWPVTLALQVLLAYMFFLPGLAAFMTLFSLQAGSVLLLVPGVWRWIAYAVVIVSWSTLYAIVPLHGLTAAEQGPTYALFEGAFLALIGMVVYGLSWLAGLTGQLERLRGEVSRMAAVQERLRVGRDVHDLLGLGLSTVALKADLAGALIGRDDVRASEEIAEVSRICAEAQADTRLVHEDGARLSLIDELTSAKQVLASVGIKVNADMPEVPLPAAADEVLAPVLREAVTNVLRHSTATRCIIAVTASTGTLRLQVSNDGIRRHPAAEAPASGGGGRGLANLTARTQAAGGRLTYHQDTRAFELSAEVPLPSASYLRSQPVGFGGDTHCVDPVAGVELGDR